MAQSDQYPEIDDDALDWQRTGSRSLLSCVSMGLTIFGGVSRAITPRGLSLPLITIIDIDNGDDPWPD